MDQFNNRIMDLMYHMPAVSGTFKDYCMDCPLLGGPTEILLNSKTEATASKI